MLDMCNLRNTRQQDMKNVNTLKKKKKKKTKQRKTWWQQMACGRIRERERKKKRWVKWQQRLNRNLILAGSISDICHSIIYLYLNKSMRRLIVKQYWIVYYVCLLLISFFLNFFLCGNFAHAIGIGLCGLLCGCVGRSVVWFLFLFWFLVSCWCNFGKQKWLSRRPKKKSDQQFVRCLTVA